MAGVGIGWWCGYGFSRSQEERRAWQIRTARQEYTQVQLAGRCGGGVPESERLQDGDGTGDRTRWPSVIRGRHRQDEGPQQVGLMWFLGEGVGCGRAHREVRQWGSNPA